MSGTDMYQLTDTTDPGSHFIHKGTEEGRAGSPAQAPRGLSTTETSHPVRFLQVKGERELRVSRANTMRVQSVTPTPVNELWEIYH